MNRMLLSLGVCGLLASSICAAKEDVAPNGDWTSSIRDAKCESTSYNGYKLYVFVRLHYEKRGSEYFVVLDQYHYYISGQKKAYDLLVEMDLETWSDSARKNNYKHFSWAKNNHRGAAPDTWYTPAPAMRTGGNPGYSSGVLNGGLKVSTPDFYCWIDDYYNF